MLGRKYTGSTGFDFEIGDESGVPSGRRDGTHLCDHCRQEPSII